MNRNWEKWLVNIDTSLRSALEVLVSAGSKVVFVVDQKDILQGTVSDGDLRRAQLSNVNLDSPVTDIMNRDPVVVNPDFSESQIKKLFAKYRITEIPVLQEGHVIDILSVHELLGGYSYNNPVFLMAGGYGSRLYPLTTTCPKPLLKIGDRPMLETTFRRFLDCGFSKFFISTHYLPNLITEHFGDGSKYGAEITYIHEEEPLGTAGALGLLPKEQIKQPIVMINGDILTKVDFGKLLQYHKEHKGVATMGVRQYDFEVPYGVVESSDGFVLSITEKPVQTFVVNAGIYIFEPEVLEGIEPNQHLDMPSLLSTLIQDGSNVALYLVNEYWLDVGRLEDFERANGEFEQNF